MMKHTSISSISIQDNEQKTQIYIYVWANLLDQFEPLLGNTNVLKGIMT